MKKYALSPDQLLVIDDMKAAVEMSRAAHVQIGFAGWGRQEYPEICAEMRNLCNYTFMEVEELEKFLFT